MSIIDHIQYLVSTHDCVVVAGLGAFVAQQSPSRLSADGSTLLPPSRALVFNSNVVHDDGLLSGSIARRNSISCDEAGREIARQVETLVNRLDIEGEINIPRIGQLSKTESGAIEFTPTSVNPIVNARYATLSPIALSQAIVEKTDATETPILNVEIKPKRSLMSRSVRATVRYAATVALLIGIGITASTPIILDQTHDRASIELPSVKGAKKAVAPIASAAPTGTQSTSATTAETKPATATATGTETSENNNTTADKPTPDIVPVKQLSEIKDRSAYDCYIIVASCSSMREANRFIATHGGKDMLQVIPSDGRYRVYAAIANDFDKAYSFKETDRSFREKYPSAWIYRQK